MDAINNIEYRGYTISIMYDDYPENPRDWSNLGRMVCFHKRYDLGDKHELDTCMFSGWEDMKQYIMEEYDCAVILPIYMYDHSGILLSTAPFSCPFDSGQLGFVYATKEGARSEFGKVLTQKRLSEVNDVLKNEVERYSQYLSGDTYYYIIYDSCGDQVESCGTYYGHDGIKQLKEDAKSDIDYYLSTAVKGNAGAMV